MRRSVVGASVLACLLSVGMVVETSSAGFRGSTPSSGSSAAAGALTGPATASASPSTLLCRITVSWPTAGVPAWASGYRVYRATSSSGPFGQIGTAAGAATASYQDNDSALRAGTTYHYQVRAYLTGTSWLSAASTTASAAAPTSCL